MTTFGLILMAVFAFVAVLAKPLDPVKRAISEDMRDKKNAQPEKEEVEPKTKKSSTLVQHIMVTLLAVAIMGFFALITVMAKPLDPIKRAISDFSFTDVYYEIQGDADTCRFITIVDLTKVTKRGDIAQVLIDIEKANPKVIGLDCVFDNEGEDFEGNDSIIKVAETYKNIVFSEKMLDWANDSVGYTKAIHSFFQEFVDIKEGTSNMPRSLYDSMKRKLPLSEKYNGKRYPSLVAQIANEYTEKDMTRGRTEDININFRRTAFHVLQPEEVKAHPELINGQIVLFGAMYEDSDMHWSPVGKIAGVELLAYSIQTLITQKEIKDVPIIPFCIISLLLIFMVQVMQASYLKRTSNSKNMFVRYVIGSSYVLSILTFLFTSVFLGISFFVFSLFCISFNLAWALSVIAFLGTSRSMYAAIKDYAESMKDKYSVLKKINI